MLNPVSNINTADSSTYKDLFGKNKNNRSAEEAGARVREIITQFENLSTNKNISAKEEIKNISEMTSKKEEDDRVSYERLGNKLKEIAEINEVHFEFVLDKDNDKMLIRIIDDSTKEVINQIPSEMTLKIAKMLDEMLGRGQIADATI